MLTLSAILQIIFGINTGFLFTNTFTSQFTKDITGISTSIKSQLNDKKQDLKGAKGHIQDRLAESTAYAGRMKNLDKLEVWRGYLDVVTNKILSWLNSSRGFSYYCFYTAILSLGFLVIGGIYGNELTLEQNSNIISFVIVSFLIVVFFNTLLHIIPFFKKRFNGYLLVIFSLLLTIYVVNHEVVNRNMLDILDIFTQKEITKLTSILILLVLSVHFKFEIFCSIILALIIKTVLWINFIFIGLIQKFILYRLEFQVETIRIDRQSNNAQGNDTQNTGTND